ncbi:unnamed protein product [Prunus armeniaca]|uniref:Uncharacterized protein n=1 Tax=Prunus armeniaca TaxID=36596 RepID=A0A6J5WCP0_PRUAR|nr:unnamed protein product [Prunus armeniaca]
MAEPKIAPEPMAVAESKIALEPVLEPKIQLVELKIAPEPVAQPKIQLEPLAELTIVEAVTEVKMALKVALEPKIASVATTYLKMALDDVLNFAM